MPSRISVTLAIILLLPFGGSRAQAAMETGARYVSEGVTASENPTPVQLLRNDWQKTCAQASTIRDGILQDSRQVDGHLDSALDALLADGSTTGFETVLAYFDAVRAAVLNTMDFTARDGPALACLNAQEASNSTLFQEMHCENRPAICRRVSEYLHKTDEIRLNYYSAHEQSVLAARTINDRINFTISNPHLLLFVDVAEILNETHDLFHNLLRVVEHAGDRWEHLNSEIY